MDLVDLVDQLAGEAIERVDGVLNGLGSAGQEAADKAGANRELGPALNGCDRDLNPAIDGFSLELQAAVLPAEDDGG